MGEIRFVGTGETRGYPYLVCKKEFSGTAKNRTKSVAEVRKTYLKLFRSVTVFSFSFLYIRAQLFKASLA